ncbi:purine-nucleoside phosphorylase [Labrys wisconsinensis]|uniref:Purine nucleoside phosphorylase n=1 Tax=Labrys wisconsinensis TaxID=425677 RepID=A0ABU0JDR5_9HYPH|nr:purine-nucleoside phosphorylase [Labrys wisconsinensis]MDQ0472422.1 purine-nucleoside phosphorylase [Labrys wisconsinensis]
MGFLPELLHPRSAQASRLAAEAVRAAAGVEPVEIGLVLGTGLGALVEEVEDAVATAYAAIPHFPASGVTGHAGRLVVGRLAGRRVALFQGRAHYYEQGDAAAMRVPLETLALLGASTVLLTNSCGSLKPEIAPASLVALADHINWTGLNPLIGDPSDARFVNMVDAYDPGLRAQLARAARAAGFDLPEGVYAWYSGPSFETPAEIRAARIMGADLVGMSTVPEVILARRLGLRVAAVAMATNYGAGMDEREVISHAQTKAVALKGVAKMQALIRGFLAELAP